MPLSSLNDTINRLTNSFQTFQVKSGARVNSIVYNIEVLYPQTMHTKPLWNRYNVNLKSFNEAIKALDSTQFKDWVGYVHSSLDGYLDLHGNKAKIQRIRISESETVFINARSKLKKVPIFYAI